MTKNVIYVGMLAVIAIGIISFLLWKRQDKVAAGPQVHYVTSPASATGPANNPTPTAEYPQLSIKNVSREEATKTYVERLRSDPQADWKVPIDFYGKVVDENNQPVPGATVRYQWTTVGVAGGVSQAQGESDEKGLFSLTNQHGKNLGVRVEKEGYYTVEGGAGNVAFEFANPSDKNYYEPDASNPVIFHLRKKDVNASQLLHWKRKLRFTQTNTTKLDLKTGRPSVDNSPSLVVTLLDDNSPETWTIEAGVSGGGLQIEAEQFPFLAPSTGYQPTVTLNAKTPPPPTWYGDTLFRGGGIFVQTPEGYGRYEIRMMLGLKFIEIEGYFNPDSNSRVLETSSN